MSDLTIIAAFQNLPLDALRRLEHGSIVLEPRSGSRLITQGDATNSVYAFVGGNGFVRIGSSGR
jgi:hypothetical protein